MNETQLTKTLQGLAHSIVRNEIVTEHFLCGKVPVSRDELGAKVREIDAELKDPGDTRLQRRFPELFPENSLRWIALSRTKAMRAEKPKPKKPLPKRAAQHLGRLTRR